MAIYRMVAVPGFLAGAVLAVTLWALRDRRYPKARWSLLVVLLVAGSPLMLQALEIGHPEEMLGAALCVGAVLAARTRSRGSLRCSWGSRSATRRGLSSR